MTLRELNLETSTMSSTTGNNEIVPELIEREINNVTHPRLSNATQQISVNIMNKIIMKV